MGCTNSKLDGLPAVSLCRDRCNFLAEALRSSYVLTDAHVAYLQSLKTVGPALHRFLDQAVDLPSDGDPVITETCGEPQKASSVSSPDHSLSTSHSDSHPRFDSDSDEEERYRVGHNDLSGSPNPETQISNHDLFMSIDYMKNQPTQSIPYSNYYNHAPNLYRNYDSGTRTPPPPPAPSSSTWDFLNFFETYEPPYAITSKEVKEKEANHDLEDGSIKDALKDKTFQGNHAKTKTKEERICLKDPEKNTNSEKEKYIEKSVPSETESKSDKRGVSEVVRQLQELFEKASEAGDVVSKMFDTAKFRRYHKTSVSQVSSNIFYAVSPSFLGASSPSSKKTSSLIPNLDEEDFGLSFSNLSSTLKKLCVWEKKLYHEVKAEEKLHRAHAKNYKQLKRLEEKVDDVHKVESTQTLIRSLSTRMSVAVHMIDKISITINNLRDEELWPQVKQLIHRLSEMWKAMLECHSRQSYIIATNRSLLDAVVLNGKLNGDQLEMAITLKSELRNWSLSLSNWIGAQKCYAKALNGWVMRCLTHEPQETTPDFPVPIGAPPVFGIFNKWSQSLEGLSEKEVTEAIYGLLTSVNHLLEEHRVELMQQKSLGDKEIERKMLILEEEQQKMRKFVQTQEKRVKLSAESIDNSDMKSSLEKIFMSMERLAATSKQAYEKLDLMYV